MFSTYSLLRRKFSSVVIVNGKRTPIGSFMGSLADVPATLLGSGAIKGSLSVSKLNPEDIDEVVMGNVISSGLGQAPARQAAIKAGLPPKTICTTINKVCSSGLKAITFASQSIRLGDSKIIVAGGMENMSLVPHYSYRRKAVSYGNIPILDGIVVDGLSDAYDGKPMGNCAEKTNRDLKIGRVESDEYCIESYERTLEAIKKNILAKEIVPIIYQNNKKQDISVDIDEEPTKFKKDKIPGLKPAFEKDGTITAANASKINDGAAALILMDENEAKRRGLKTIARVVGYADAEIEPVDFSIAPASAVKKVLSKCNLSVKDIDFWEFNEAFSSVVLANMKLLGLDKSKVNLHGGAVALGHPIGMSGARIALSLINVLQEKQGKYGLATICNGGGGASAIILERL